MPRRKKGPTRSTRVWGQWFVDRRSTDGNVLVGNGLYTVSMEFADPDARLLGGVHLSIHDRMRSTRHDWREFQRIKNELVGPEREAVEIYPAESRLVDGSNEYHLWVLPAGESIPLGFAERSVLDADFRVDPADPDVARFATELGENPVVFAAKVNARAKQRKLAKKGP